MEREYEVMSQFFLLQENKNYTVVVKFGNVVRDVL